MEVLFQAPMANMNVATVCIDVHSKFVSSVVTQLASRALLAQALWELAKAGPSVPVSGFTQGLARYSWNATQARHGGSRPSPTVHLQHLVGYTAPVCGGSTLTGTSHQRDPSNSAPCFILLQARCSWVAI